MNHKMTRSSQVLSAITKVPEVAAGISNGTTRSSTSGAVKRVCKRGTVNPGERDTVRRTIRLRSSHHTRNRRKIGNGLGNRITPSNPRNIVTVRIDENNVANREGLRRSGSVHNLERNRGKNSICCNGGGGIRREDSIRDGKLAVRTLLRVCSRCERLPGTNLTLLVRGTSW